MARPARIRSALEELIGGSERHDWSVEALTEALNGAGVTADFSTVWRALQQLERDGAVRQVEFGDGKVRYEKAARHHEHVKCNRCGVVSAVEGCMLEDAAQTVESLTGFRISGHELLFQGLCPLCRGEDR